MPASLDLLSTNAHLSPLSYTFESFFQCTLVWLVSEYQERPQFGVLSGELGPLSCWMSLIAPAAVQVSVLSFQRAPQAYWLTSSSQDPHLLRLLLFPASWCHLYK